MTNLEFYRHEIAYILDEGEVFGVMGGIPTPCHCEECRQCLADRHRMVRENELVCDMEKIVNWMLAEHEEGKDAEH